MFRRTKEQKAEARASIAATIKSVMAMSDEELSAGLLDYDCTCGISMLVDDDDPEPTCLCGRRLR